MKKNLFSKVKKGLLINNFKKIQFTKYNKNLRFYSTGGQSVLILAEHNNNELISGTLNTVTAATKISSNVSLLVAGNNADKVVENAKKLKGVSNVLYVNDSVHQTATAENLSKLIVEIQKSKNFTHIISPASSFGKSVLPRVAGLLDVGSVTDVIQIDSEDTFRRPIYAGNAIMTLKSLDSVKVKTKNVSFLFGYVRSKKKKKM